MSTHLKILLIVTVIGIIAMAMAFFDRQNISKNKNILSNTAVDLTDHVLKASNDEAQLIEMKKKTKEKVRVVKGISSSNRMETPIFDQPDEIPDEEYIKARIEKIMQAHRKRTGQNNKESPEEKAERERIRQKNAKIINNLTGVESTFFAFDRAVDVSIVSGIGEDDIFYDFLEDFEKQALLNPTIEQTTENYINTFSATLEGIEGNNIVMTDFQCGQASCIGSFNSYNNDDWGDFIRLRKEFFNERYPMNTYMEYPQIREQGVTLHRIFFSINGNIDGFYESGQ